MARGDYETMMKKIAYVEELTRKDPSQTMNDISKAVMEKFGTQLAFDKLRVAFLENGGVLRPRGRKPRDGRDGLSVVSPSGIIGDRRSAGRRDSDVSGARAKQTLGRMPAYMVVKFEGGELQTNEFKNRDEARRFIEKSLNDGFSPADIGFYERNKIEVSVGI